MNLTDLIELITPTLSSSEGEDDKDIKTLDNQIREVSAKISGLEASLILLKDKADLSEDIAEISALIMNFPYDDLRASIGKIKKRYRQNFDKSISHFELTLKEIKNEVLETFRSGEFDLELRSSKEFYDVKNEVLETLQKYEIKKNRSFLRFLPFLLYIIPAVFFYLLGVYLRLDRSTSLIQAQVVNPHNAYFIDSSENNKYELSDQYRQRFIRDFSRYYFDRPNRFDWFFDEGNRHSLVFKFVLKNASKTNPLIVSTVDVVLDYDDSKNFPWKDLDVQPEIEFEASKDSFEFTNTGVGPALNFQYEGNTESGIVKFKNSEEFFSDAVFNTFMWGAIGVSLDNCWHYDSEIAIQNIVDERLEQPLFFQEGGVRRIEVVETLSRLKEITSVSHKEKVMLKYSYLSLDNQRHQGEFQTQLPENLAYYVRRPDLLEYDPRQVQGCAQAQAIPSSSASANFGPVVPSVSDDTNNAIITALAPNDIISSEAPEGVDSVTSTLELDLAALRVGESSAAIESPDTLLNPGGSLFMYVTLSEPQNGSYSMKVNLNGKELKLFSFDTLVPVSDELRFTFPDSLQYFDADLKIKSEED